MEFKILAPILFGKKVKLSRTDYRNITFTRGILRVKLICMHADFFPYSFSLFCCFQRYMLCDIFVLNKKEYLALWSSTTERFVARVKWKQIRKLPVSNAQLSNIKTWKFIKCVWLNLRNELIWLSLTLERSNINNNAITPKSIYTYTACIMYLPYILVYTQILSHINVQWCFHYELLWMCCVCMHICFRKVFTQRECVVCRRTRWVILFVSFFLCVCVCVCLCFFVTRFFHH